MNHLQFFQSIGYMMKTLEKKKAHLEAMEARTEYSGVRITDTPGGGSDPAARRTDALVLLMTERESVESYEKEIMRRRMKAELMIDVLSDDTMAAVFRMRYLDGMTWDALADALCISERWAFELQKKGLRRMRECFPDV